MVDGTFHNGSDFVKGIPFLGISLDSEEHAKIHIFVGASGASFGSGGAGSFAVADIFTFNHMNFGTNPFATVCTSLFPGNTTILHGKGRVIWTGGITVFVVTDFFEAAFISGVVRNQSFGKMKFVQQNPIGFDGIEGGISPKDIRMKVRVQGKEIGKHRFQGSCIPDGLIFIRRIRFLFYSHFRMIRRESVGMEKIFCRIRAERKPVSG